MTPAIKTYQITYGRELVEIFRNEHLKRFRGKWKKFFRQSLQGGLPKLLVFFKYKSTEPIVIVSS